MGIRWVHLNDCVEEIHPHRPLPWLYVPPPLPHKSAVVRTPHNRAEVTCSDVTAKEETRHIRQSLIHNGYPRGMCFSTTGPKIVRGPQTTSIKAQGHSPLCAGPVWGGATSPWPTGVKVSSHPNTTHSQTTTGETKEPSPYGRDVGSGVPSLLFWLLCHTYVDQTGRCLGKCLKEHRRAVESEDCENSTLAEHAWSHHHRMDWAKG